jgi:hypothetical protein
MSDIYDDPDLVPPSGDYDDTVRFENVGDRVRGRILRILKINTRFGPTLKYVLQTDDGPRDMLAGGVNLKGQLFELKPREGDVLDVKLVELRNVAQGTAKIYDIHVEPGSAPVPTTARAVTPPPQTAAVESSDDDIFGE